MKATTGIAIACLSALTFAYCADTVAWAQAPAPAAPQPGTTNQDSTNDLSLAVGKSVVLDLAPVRWDRRVRESCMGRLRRVLPVVA